MATYPIPVQFKAAFTTGAGSSVTTASITTTNGNQFIVLVAGEVAPPNSGSAITDSKSNTWAIAARTTTGDSKLAIYYSTTALGGSSHTFTYTPASSDFCNITVFEVSNMATSSMLSNTNSTVANSTTHSSGNITAGASNELFVGLVGMDHIAEGAGTITAGGRWYLGSSISPGASNEGANVGFRFADAGVTDQFTVVVGSAFNSGAIIAGFKVLASAPSSTAFAAAFA